MSPAYSTFLPASKINTLSRLVSRSGLAAPPTGLENFRGLDWICSIFRLILFFVFLTLHFSVFSACFFVCVFVYITLFPLSHDPVKLYHVSPTGTVLAPL